MSQGALPADRASQRREVQQPADAPDMTLLEKAAYLSLVGLFCLAILVLAAVTKAILVPVIVAAVLATILLPIVKAGADFGIPRTVVAVGLALLLAVLLAGAVIILTLPISYWIGRASELGQILREKLSAIDQPLSALQQLFSALHEFSGGPRPVVAVDTSQTNMVETILGVLTPAFGQFLLFFGALIFYLVYHDDIVRALVLFWRDRKVRLNVLKIVGDVERQMSVYFGTVALINLGLGVATAIVAWAAGLASPVLWGLLAAAMNFLPYLGATAVTITLLLAGLLTYPTLLHALVAPALFLVLTTVEGQILTPSIIGRRLTMNPFLVFLAMGFWTWLWGPVGAFLAVPLVLAGVVVMRTLVPDDKPLLPD